MASREEEMAWPITPSFFFDNCIEGFSVFSAS